MKVTLHAQRVLRFQGIVFGVLFLLVIGLCAWLSVKYSYQADWTANNRNTLSPATLQLLKTIDGPVSITAYARKTQLLRNRISGLVNRYQRAKSDIELKFVNPDLEPDQARDLGISVDGEMIVEYRGRSEHVTDSTEQALSNVLQQLVRVGERHVVFLQGHGERDPHGKAGYDLSQWVNELQTKGIRTETVNLGRDGKLPTSTSVLVIASPQADLLPGEVAIITRFVDQGGHLLWLHDPGDLHGLDKLAEKMGILFLPGMIIDPNVSQIGMMLFGSDDPRICLVTSYPDSPIVGNFQFNTLFPVSGGLDVPDGSPWQHEYILQSMSNTWLETQQKSGQITFDKDSDVPGPVVIGVSLTRQPDGDDGNKDSAPQRAVVIADGDFLSNAFLGLGGNFQLAMNIINWLSSDDQLLNIPVKTAGDISLQLTDLQIGTISVSFLFVLPALLLGSGFWIWWRRRRY